MFKRSAIGPSRSPFGKVLALIAATIALAPALLLERAFNAARCWGKVRLGYRENTSSAALGFFDEASAARASSRTNGSADLAKGTKASIAELRSSRSACSAARTLAFCFSIATKSVSNDANWKPPIKLTPIPRSSSLPPRRAFAASLSKGAILVGSSLVFCASSFSATEARDFPFESKALSASPQPASSGNCARRKSSSSFGARSSCGSSFATRDALVFGSSASDASTRASTGSLAASGVSRNLATASGCSSRNMRTK